MRTKGLAALRWGIVGLLVIGAQLGATAGAATLRWKFRPGETLHYVMEQKTITTGKQGQQELRTTVTQTIELDWVVKDVAKDGVAGLTQTITRIRTRIESPFAAAFEYDSKDSKSTAGVIGAALIPLLKSLVGAEFAFKMDPRGELTDIEVPEGVVKAIREAGPMAGAGGMFTTEGMKNLIAESSLAVPREEIAKGKSWARPSKKVAFAPIGFMKFDKTYSYQGPETRDGKAVERIDLDIKIDVERSPESKVDFEVKTREGKGSFFFDNAAGRVVDSVVTEKVGMVFKFMNNEVSQANETTTTMKLANAAEAAAPGK